MVRREGFRSTVGEDADVELEILLRGDRGRREAGATAIWPQVYGREGVTGGIERRSK